MSHGPQGGSVADWLARLGFDWPGARRLVWSRTVARRVDALQTTRVLGRVLESLRPLSHPVILDLGPLCGTNVTFLGGELPCRLIVADLFAELDRAMRDGGPESLSRAIAATLTQPPASLDAVFCWDVCDYLPRDAIVALAPALARVLKPGGIALAMFSTVMFEAPQFTRFAIADAEHIHYRRFPCALVQERVWLSRDAARLLAPLRVDETYLQSHGVREVLLRNPEA